MRVVADINIIVSAALLPESLPRRAMDHVVSRHTLVITPALVESLAHTLMRPKFDRYVTPDDRAMLLHQVVSAAELVTIERRVRVCRDADDDAVLEAAVNGRASHILTGTAICWCFTPSKTSRSSIRAHG